MHFIGPSDIPLDLGEFDNLKDKITFYGRLDLKTGYEISKKCIIAPTIPHIRTVRNRHIAIPANCLCIPIDCP